MAEENEKNTGKYISIEHIFANKVNLGEDGNTEPNENTQFTAEEFNGIVRALKELYEATSTKLFKEMWIVPKSSTPGSTSKNVTVKKGDNVSITFSYLYRERTGFGDWNEKISDSCHFTVKAKKFGSSDEPSVEYDSRIAGDNGEERPLNAGVEFSLDLNDYFRGVSGGKYEFEVKAESLYKTNDEGNPLTFTFYYYITFTDMSLSFKTEDWWKTAFSQNDNDGYINLQFSAPGSGEREIVLNYSGSGISPSSYPEQIIDAPAGTIDVNHQIKHPGKNVVMTVTAYIRSKENIDVRTDSISGQFICIKSAPGTIRLMAINNLLKQVDTGSSVKLFDYAIYDSLATDGQTNVSFKTVIDKDGDKINDVDTNSGKKSMSTVYSFNYDLGSIEANNDYKLLISATCSGSRVLSETTVSVSNKTTFSPVLGASWYMNPVGRNNLEDRREEIKNSMNGTYHTATWTNFSWSENDGWCTKTETDRFGGSVTSSFLRVPSGSKVNINYTPLKMANSTDVRTIEFDYIVRNVSDYNLPVIDITSDRKSVV